MNSLLPTRASLAAKVSQVSGFLHWGKPFLPLNKHSSRLLSHTLEEIGCKARFVDGAVGHKLHPQSVGAGFHGLRLLVATEVANQGALLCGPVSDFQIVICTTVMPFDLKRKTEAMWVTLAGLASRIFFNSESKPSHLSQS